MAQLHNLFPVALIGLTCGFYDSIYYNWVHLKIYLIPKTEFDTDLFAL
jgi:hypothetical protein